MSSTAIGADGSIDQRHTCDGADEPLPLAWTGLPQETKAIALTMIDRDADNFVHWVLCNLDPAANADGLTEDPAAMPTVQNDFGRPGSGGPCPPPGDGPHAYVITVHALGSLVSAEGEGSLADEIERERIDGGALIGSYERKQ